MKAIDNNIESALKNKNTFPKLFGIIVLFVAFILICYAHGLTSISDANFSPINGDYQTYNSIRRMYDGQVPFKDFTAYLGTGISYITFLASVFFGNSLVASKMAMNSLCLFCLGCTVIVIVYLRTKELVTSLVIGTIFVGLSIFTNLASSIPVISELQYSLFLMSYNSLRPVRAVIPIIVIPGIIFIAKRLDLSRFSNKVVYTYSIPILLGASASIGRLYSNDIGLAFLVAMLLSYTLLEARSKKKLLLGLGCLLVSYIIFLFIFCEIFTQGNFMSWYKYNSIFGGCGQYQKWYYGDGGSKLYSITDYSKLFSYLSWQEWLTMLYGTFILYRQKKIDMNRTFSDNVYTFCLALVCYTIVIANNAYKIGANITAVYLPQINIVVIAILVTECLLFLRRILERRLTAKMMQIVNNYRRLVILTIVSMMTCISAVMILNATYNQSAERKTDVEKVLGGTCYNETSISKYVATIGDGTVFSTYASAVENVLDTYQPTGTDYIIHVLGDDMRQRYLNVFQSTDYDFVATQNPSMIKWEYWIMRANWFFYRELLAKYIPSYDDNYLVLWKKASEDQKKSIPENTKIFVEKGVITVHIPNYYLAGPCIMDLSVKYAISYKNNKRFSKFMTRGAQIEVTDTWSTLSQDLNIYGLPVEGVVTKNIPIYISENGVGQLKFSSYPTAYTEVDISEVIPVSLLPAHQYIAKDWNDNSVLQYALLLEEEDELDTENSSYLRISPLTDANWTNGILNGTQVLLLPKTDRNVEKLSTAVKLRAGNTYATITSINIVEQWIRVTVETDNIEQFAYPSKIEIINGDDYNDS